MRNLKRVLSLALACVMVIGMMVMTTGAADFTDADEIKYAEAVEVANALGIIEGYNGIFDPEGELYRDQGAKFIAYLLLGKEKADMLQGTGKFTDVTWAAGYVEYCYNVGICTGYTDTLFGAADTLTGWAFGKWLLVAMGNDADECGYNGGNYIFDITVDMMENGLVLDGMDVTETLTRQQAAEMLLIALKSGGTTTTYYKVFSDNVTDNGEIDEGETVYGSFTSPSEAYILKAALAGTAPAVEIATVDVTTGTMMQELYDVSYIDAVDAYSRPGKAYTDGEVDGLYKFYADEPVATFEGPVAKKDLFAAAGIKTPGTTEFTYTLIANNATVGGTHKALKAGQDGAVAAADGTAEGVKSELYMEMVGETPVYTLITVEEFMGTVAVNEIDENVEGDTRTITVTLADGTTVCDEYETEEFEDDDEVLVTIAWDTDAYAVQTITVPEAVEGKITKITSDGVYTIGAGEYVESKHFASTNNDLGDEGEWYVDSMGNLIGDKAAAPDPETVWYFGLVLDADASEYVAANSGDLLTAATEAKDAKELVKLVTAEGETVILSTAWEYTKTNGVITGTTWVNGSWAGEGEERAYTANCNTGDLVKYSLEDGKIDEIVAIENGTTGVTGGTALDVVKNDATLGADGNETGKLVNDKTLFFVYQPAVGEDPAEVVVYTGYKNIPAAGLSTDTAYEYFYATKVVAGTPAVDDTTVAAVVITVDDVDVEEAPQYGLVWYANTDYYTTKDGNATVTTYTNVYLNGVKGEISFKGDHFAPAVGTLYYYAVDEDGYASTPYNAANGNEGKLDTTKTISVVEDEYYVSSHSTYPVVYFDADTVFYQVDETTKAVSVVDGLPTTVATGYTLEQICFFWADNNLTMDADHPVAIVYFAVKEVSEG